MSESVLTSLLSERIEDALLLLDAEDRALFTSRAFREAMGAERAGAGVPALLHRVHAQDRAALLATLLQPRSDLARVRFRVRAAAGSWRHLELQVHRLPELRLARLVPVAGDDAQDPLRRIAVHLEVALWLIEVPSGILRYVSPGFESVWGCSPDRVAHDADAFFATIHPDDREGVRKLVLGSWSSGFEQEFRVATPDGGIRWLRHRCLPLRAADGRIDAAVGITQNVTERRAAQDALIRAEERLRVVASSGFQIVTEIDASGAITWVGPRDHELSLLGPDDAPLRPRPELIHPEDRSRAFRRISAAVRDERSVSVEFRIPTRSGDWRWIETTVGPYRTADGEKRALMMSRDVSDRIEVLRRLRESEERHRHLVENSPEGIFVYADERVVYANHAGARLLGAASPDELLGVESLALVAPESSDAAAQTFRAFAEGRIERAALELRLRRLDGEARDVMWSGNLIHYAGRRAIQSVVRDITEWRIAERERARLEAQLQEARKLESLGVLAGGIAHDFNNLLAVILGNARFARRHAGEPQEVRSALEDAVDAAESASRLTRQLLAYAGRRLPEVRPVDLSAHTRSVGELLETAVPKKIHLALDLAEDLPSVRADVVQLEQVTMNLLFNASEAIGDEAGEICIRTGVENVSADRIAGWIGAERLAPGRFVRLEVTDTGCGMDEDRRRRIFDPFFTTKPVGHGLGLSAVLGFVRGHEGGIEIESRVGEGTAIRIFLPASGEAVPADPPHDARPPELRACVLVVDDEPGIRRVVERMLRERGCRVLHAADGVKALEILRARADEIDVVLLDLNMPHTSGEETLARVRELDPQLPVLLASGYDASELARRTVEDPHTGFLSKPFVENEIAAKIDELLRGSRR